MRPLAICTPCWRTFASVVPSSPAPCLVGQRRAWLASGVSGWPAACLVGQRRAWFASGVCLRREHVALFAISAWRRAHAARRVAL